MGKGETKVKKVPSALLLLTHNAIVDIRGETYNSFLGYNIFNDSEFIEIKKKDAMRLPTPVIELLGCAKKRINLADLLTKNRKEMGKILGMSERNLYRLLDKAEIFNPEQLPAVNKKKKNKK